MQPELPQQTPTPQQPMQTPLQATTPPPVVSQSPKSRKTGLIIGIIVGVLVLIGGAIAAYFLFFAPPNKEDYKEALQHTNSMNQVGEAVEGRLNAVGKITNEEEAAKAREEIKKTFSEFRKKLDELKGKKALRDEEVATAANTFIDDMTKLINAIEPFAEDFSRLATIYSKCNATIINQAVNEAATTQGAVTNLEDVKKQFASCSKEVSGVNELKGESGKAVKQALSELYEKAPAIIDKMINALNTSNQITYAAATREMTAALQSVTAVIREKVKEAGEEGDSEKVKENLSKLIDLLEKKAQ